ncbi:hypothetical protein EIP86_002639 [Pleurotus ostreatoroseus]|nr:hypothetical protein EIP86_002639 [Pleurotus ostreatoroseus]
MSRYRLRVPSASPLRLAFVSQILKCMVPLLLTLLASAAPQPIVRTVPDAFDYIVIGGGAAGLVLAERLSRDPNITVAVLEAGYLAESDMTLVPEVYASFIGTSIDWGFSTVPQTHAAGQSVALPRGKALGGTSTVNGMYFVRASQPEYDAFTTLGNPGWDWDSINAHINAVETFYPFAASPPNNLHPLKASAFQAIDDPADHGSTGPIQVSYSNFWRIPGRVIKGFLDSLVALGVPRNGHAANGDPLGSWQAPTTVTPLNRSRSYAANAFLLPHFGRTNLVVHEGAVVSKIVFDGSSDLGGVTAASVEYIPDGDSASATVSVPLTSSGRVVVTAGEPSSVLVNSFVERCWASGTYQSPKILELSGIGDPAVLSAFDISTVVNLTGVGENMQDHVAVLTSFELVEGLGSGGTAEDLSRNATFASKQWARYTNHRAGAYASVPGTTVSMIPLQVFINETTLVPMLAALDTVLDEVYTGTPQETQIRLQRSWLDNATIPQVELVLLPGLMDPSITPNASRHHITIAANYMRPFSRGNTHLSSADPLALPRIDPNYLAITDFEVGVLREAIRFVVERLTETSPLVSLIGAALNPLPGMSDEQLNTYVKEGMFSSWHPCGTTSMLPLNQGGVVDPNLKVYGTQNVYVADAGIIPLELGTHTMATVYGNALKAAEMLLSS